MNSAWKYVSAFFAGILLMACEKNECTQRFTSNVQGNFWRSDSLGLEQKQIIPVFSLYGMGREDSMLYNQNVQIEVFVLPLSPEFDERSFVMSNDTIADTITFTYTSKLNLVNTVCGFVPNYTIRKVETTHNFIESIRIENDDVNSDEKNNLKIYIF